MPEIHPRKIENAIRFPDSLAKFINLHQANGEYTKYMFSEQFGYGHREILLKYCGLDFSTQLLGNLQHGVLRDHLFLDFRTPRYFGLRKSKFWVFARTYEQLARKMGNKHVIAIGAPWLYLRDSTSSDLDFSQRSERVLIMPGHTAGAYITTASKTQKKLRASGFRKLVGSREATVCLHAVDFCNPWTIEPFLEEGFSVICVGSSNIHPLWTEAGNRIRMLHTLMGHMMSHSHLLTDRLGSHVYYGIDMGMNVGIFPELSLFNPIEDVSGRDQRYVDSEYENEEIEYVAQVMPEALNQFAPSGKYNELSDEILGREAVRNPEELLQILDYRKNIYPISSIQPW